MRSFNPSSGPLMAHAATDPAAAHGRGTGLTCPACGSMYPAGTPICPIDGNVLAGGQEGSGPLRLLPKPGSRVQNYRLIDVLGEGSMGRVYLAENEAIGRIVALKMLHPTLLQSRAATEAFINEARTVNQIRHRNIIEITDFVVTGSGSGCFLVMERLEGQTLEQVLRLSAPLAAERAVWIGEQICDALAAAHQVGVVHRDLKPGNVFVLEREGQSDFVKLIDFGVAKILRSATDQMRRTAGGGGHDMRYIIGTPAYMSPEQTTDSAVDHRADIYAVGVLLYEMVTGRLPFHGNTLGELLDAHRHETPPMPNHTPGLLAPVPRRLEELILRCLAKAPADRPATMAAVCRALGEIRVSLADQEAPGALYGEPDWGGMVDPDDLVPRRHNITDDDLGHLSPPRRWWPTVLALTFLAGLGGAGYALLSKTSLAMLFTGSPPAAERPVGEGDRQHEGFAREEPALQPPNPAVVEPAVVEPAAVQPAPVESSSVGVPPNGSDDTTRQGGVTPTLPHPSQPAATPKTTPAEVPRAAVPTVIGPPPVGSSRARLHAGSQPPTRTPNVTPRVPDDWPPEAPGEIAPPPAPPADPPPAAPAPPAPPEGYPSTPDEAPPAPPDDAPPAPPSEPPREEPPSEAPSTPPPSGDPDRIKVPRWAAPGESGQRRIKRPSWAD